MRVIDRVKENEREWTRLIILFKNHFEVQISEIDKMDYRDFYRFLRELEQIKREESKL